MEVKKAKREKLKVPIMLTGASGSGKTVSALFIAKGIIEKMYPDLSDEEQWEKIGMIDTEHKRSLLYVNTTINDIQIGEFLHLDFEPPFSVANYIQAFNLMKNEGVEVVIVDSISHAWSGEGGIIDQVENISKGKQNMKMIAWSQVSPLEKQFLKLVTGNSVYVIATSRSKQAYDISKDERGKTVVQKLGLKPDQKDTLEYEFAISLRMDQDHTAEATKDNSNMFSRPFSVNKEVGYKIFEWSNEGIDREKVKKEKILELTALKEVSEVHEQTYSDLVSKLKDPNLNNLTEKVLDRMIELLNEVEIPEKSKPDEDTQSELEEDTTVAEDVQDVLFDGLNPPISKEDEPSK